ncbi:capZ-interacting protein isoform X2 [Trichomycterus rosablanca]|uniref:capZ-interacting protein isoform X2 n=1 Tax=Trichomycterus rosablanca TaxID=2290929 RepID=UPI002F358DE2
MSFGYTRKLLLGQIIYSGTSECATGRMEEASPVKSIVAELAGKLKDHAQPMPRNEEKPVIAPPPAPKPKLKNSPLIEKLQANLTLTPTVLLTSTKSPEVRQQAVPFCLVSPCQTQSPTLRPLQQSGTDEVPISFEQPAEGTLLPSFNKSRVRLSFNRRPPTRQHRKSAGEEVLSDTEGNSSPCDQHSVDNSPDKDCHIEEVLSTPLNETKERLTDPTDPVTEQETEQQNAHKDVIQDNGGSKDSKINEKVTEEGSETVKTLEEKADEDDESSEEMEGLEEQGEETPTEENGEEEAPED